MLQVVNTVRTSDVQGGDVGNLNAQRVLGHALVLALILLLAVGDLQGTCKTEGKKRQDKMK